MTKLRLTTLALLLGILISLKAQESTAPAQVTFAYPLGTNGQYSKDVANRFSFNVLYGINGGLKGFELGGIGNQNHGDVKGLQLAGIANITEGSSSGLVISGIANVATQSANGLHLAGIVNLASDHVKGAQIGGIANISGDETDGFMLSGLANIANGNMTGSQIGFINSAHQNMHGFQMGFINFANKLKGFQLGFVNAADSIDGAALGFISFARNGYFALETTNSEVMYATLSYKMGSTSNLYNIYTVGYSRYKSKEVYSYGLGLGTLVPLHKRHSLAIEGITNQLAYDNDWNQVNLLTKLNMSYQFNITNRISLVGGPSLNLYITEFMVDGQYGTVDMPEPVWEHKGKQNMHYMWIGYNVGINIRL